MELIHHYKFAKDKIFSYNHDQKIISALILIGSLTFLIAFFLFYFFSLKYKEFIVIQIINGIFSHISLHISAATLLGVLYGSAFGGLFFVFIPTEAIFVSFLRGGHNPILVLLIFLSGFVISYTFNYFIGMKLTNLSKMLITPKKFYSTKGIMNRYGNLAIFALNALPLPSQPLATILGVFKYNKTKFYTFFLLGQFSKYSVIILISLLF